MTGRRRFNNTSHEALQFTPYLQGREPICASGFRRDGKPISFDLPVHCIQAHAYHYGSFATHEMPLNGLILEPDENRLTLLYRCFISELFDGFELRRVALGCADHPADLSL